MQTVHTLKPAEEMRLFAGLAVQPILAVLLVLLLHPMLFPRVMQSASAGPGEPALGLALVFGVAAAIITFGGVLPTALWCMKRRRVSLPLSLLFGLLFSNLPLALLVAAGGGSRRLFTSHVLVSVIGLVGAAVFWLIAIRTLRGRV